MKFPIRTVIIASALFVLDAFVLNQGTIAIITIAIVLPVMLIRAIFARKDKELLKKRLTSAGIYAVMAGMILVSNLLNNNLARKRAETIIAACEQYKVKNGKYPDKLSSLVPEFLGEVPKAKYLLSASYDVFRYISSEGRHSLMYTETPPFGRPYYVLEERQWEYMD